MKTTEIILEDYFVNFISWHPDTLAIEKSIDGELQGHIIHFKVSYEGKTEIFGRYRWHCEYKPSAWQVNIKYYTTDELKFEYHKGDDLNILMRDSSMYFTPDEEGNICNALESIIQDDDSLEDIKLEEGINKGSVIRL